MLILKVGLLCITEVLSDQVVVAKLADTKAAGEIRALESFYSMLQTEPAKAYYGLKHVEKAAESQAVEILLLSDNLFRFVEIALCYMCLFLISFIFLIYL